MASGRQYGNALLGVRHQEEEEEAQKQHHIKAFIRNMTTSSSQYLFSSTEKSLNSRHNQRKT